MLAKPTHDHVLFFPSLSQQGDPSLGQCTDDQIAQFLHDTQSWMDSTSFVERYAWFGAMENMQGVTQVRGCPYCFLL